jgi:hypothetical protein
MIAGSLPRFANRNDKNDFATKTAKIFTTEVTEGRISNDEETAKRR